MREVKSFQAAHLSSPPFSHDNLAMPIAGMITSAAAMLEAMQTIGHYASAEQHETMLRHRAVLIFPRACTAAIISRAPLRRCTKCPPAA